MRMGRNLAREIKVVIPLFLEHLTARCGPALKERGFRLLCPCPCVSSSPSKSSFPLIIQTLPPWKRNNEAHTYCLLFYVCIYMYTNLLWVCVYICVKKNLLIVLV